MAEPIDFSWGYAPFPRGLRRHPLMTKPAALQVFTWLLTRVRNRAATIEVAGGEIELAVGQCVFGQREAGDELKLGRQAIRGATRLLQKWQIIATRATHVGTVATILNFERFDGRAPAEQPAEQPSSNPPATHRATTNERKKKGREQERAAGAAVLLLGEVGQESKLDQKRPKNADQERLLARWAELFAAKNGERPHRGPKERGQASHMVKEHGLAKCLERLELLFESPPKWVTGHLTIGTLSRFWNDLAPVNGFHDAHAEAELERMNNARGSLL